MNEHLMRALLYAALFFEDSSDDECDPDLAVKQLEHIASCVSELTPDEVEEFRAFALREAERDPMPDMAARIAPWSKGCFRRRTSKRVVGIVATKENEPPVLVVEDVS